MDHPTPSPEDTEDLLLSCRYGDLDDVKSFIGRFGTAPVGDARDENGNNVLHMASANGHIGESNRAHHARTHARTQYDARSLSDDDTHYTILHHTLSY
jgi:ankyrin repeat protein